MVFPAHTFSLLSMGFPWSAVHRDKLTPLWVLHWQQLLQETFIMEHFIGWREYTLFQEHFLLLLWLWYSLCCFSLYFIPSSSLCLAFDPFFNCFPNVSPCCLLGPGGPCGRMESFLFGMGQLLAPVHQHTTCRSPEVQHRSTISSEKRPPDSLELISPNRKNGL